MPSRWRATVTCLILSCQHSSKHPRHSPQPLPDKYTLINHSLTVVQPARHWALQCWLSDQPLLLPCQCCRRGPPERLHEAADDVRKQTERVEPEVAVGRGRLDPHARARPRCLTRHSPPQLTPAQTWNCITHTHTHTRVHTDTNVHTQGHTLLYTHMNTDTET